MLGLITDREQANVDRLALLSRKGWQNMTAAERAEWSGDPLTASDFGYDSPVNLMPRGVYYSGAVSLRYQNTSLTATATQSGVYLYAVAIIGNAGDYENKTYTLSVDSIYSNGGTPQLALYWHDDNGYEHTGAVLTEAGSVTFTIGENAGGREYLAMYIYVTTDTTVQPGTLVQYNRLMLERGDVRHEYVPYTAVLPTPATKGAYNYSDLNRVESAVEEIAEKFGLNLETKTDWGLWDVPKESDMERYIGNVIAIRDACPNKVVIPAAPGRMDGLTYTTANTIEKILDAADKSAGSVYRSGELFTGEV